MEKFLTSPVDDSAIDLILVITDVAMRDSSIARGVAPAKNCKTMSICSLHRVSRPMTDILSSVWSIVLRAAPIEVADMVLHWPARPGLSIDKHGLEPAH